MKIEYFDSAKKRESVLLIYGNEPKNVTTLRKVVHQLANEHLERFAIHELPGFEGVDGCELFFSLGRYDRGIVLLRQPRIFECSLRQVWWYNIDGLLEPFCESGTGESNNLDYGFSSDVGLIISRNRGW
jgi:hypothetical protein